MKSFNLARTWRLLLISFVVFLSACAGSNTFTVQQEVFQQLGGAATGGSYAIKEYQGQGLERKTYAELLQNNIYRTGLYQASSASTADYLVDFHYAQDARQRLVKDYYYDPVYVPYWNYFYGPNGRVYSRLTYYTSYQQYSRVRQVNYNHYTLKVLISRRSDNQSVYQSTVVANSQSALVEVMPYLMAAVFDGYPGQNAQIREIVFDLDAPGAGLGLQPNLQTPDSMQSEVEAAAKQKVDLQ